MMLGDLRVLLLLGYCLQLDSKKLDRLIHTYLGDWTAEVQRHLRKPKLKMTCDKDRGKDVESAPWFHKFNGERINDHHLKLAEKIAARGAPPC